MIQKIKKSGFTIALTIAMVMAFSVNTKAVNNEKTDSDTVSFVTFSGKVVDSESEKPVIFASVYKEGTSLGTVTNSDGEFLFKVPKEKVEGKLGISYIGYRDYAVPFNELDKKDILIKLIPSPIPIREVVIRTDDPNDLLRLAKAKIPENYRTNPLMFTSFYRETIKQNRHYVSISEAVLDIYKSGYSNSFDYDRVKIYKGRKSMDVKKMDTVLFKLQGGPKTSVLLDVVKNPASLLSEEYMIYYDYKFSGIIEVDNRQTYVISFDQKKDIDYPLYAGKIYLDAGNLAISGLEFSLSETGLENAASELVRKRPLNMKVDVEGAHYLVNYRKLDGKWQLNHVRTELNFSCKWKRKLFKSRYTTMLEMAVTDSDSTNIEKYKARESAKLSDVFAEQVNYFLDEDYWGEYNTIKPDESIESAIARLNRRLERQMY